MFSAKSVEPAASAHLAALQLKSAGAQATMGRFGNRILAFQAPHQILGAGYCADDEDEFWRAEMSQERTRRHPSA